jgi:acyl-CoA thioester hydrolase
MGVVYYANYFIWFEIGRTDYCRQHGFAYRDMEEQDGMYIIVAEAHCRYKAPARYDDEVEVRTYLKEVRRRVLVFGYEIYRQANDELLAEGGRRRRTPIDAAAAAVILRDYLANSRYQISRYEHSHRNQ